ASIGRLDQRQALQPRQLRATARDVGDVRGLRWGLERENGRIRDRADVEHVRLGIEGAAFPVRTTRRVRERQRAASAVSRLRKRGWRENRAETKRLHAFDSLGAQLRREVDEV